MSGSAKWKTKGIVLEGLNREYFVFKRDYTLEVLREGIEWNLILLCRKVECQSTCHLYSQEIEGEPCLLMKKVLENFLQTTSNFVSPRDQYHVERYLRAAISIMNFFKLCEEWKAVLADVEDWGNWFYRGMHTWLHYHHSIKALDLVNQFIQNFGFIQKEIGREYVLFVEGDCEEKAFDILKLKPDGLKNLVGVEIVNLRGKDRAKVDKIRLILKNLKERKNDFFIALDGSSRDVVRYKDDLVREKLIPENHLIIWKKEFEDAFPLETIFEALKQVCGKDLPFSLESLKKEIGEGKRFVKSVEKLLREAGEEIDYDSVKVEVVCKAAESLNMQDACELTAKLRDMDKIIEKEKNEYYFRDPDRALVYLKKRN